MKNNSFIKQISKGIGKRITSIGNNSYKKAGLNWAYIKYLKHLPSDKIHSHKLLNYKTFFRGGPEYLHGLQEIFLEEIYKQPLPENAYILDCGAHIGLSVIYLKSICSTANIIAFEPDEQNYATLSKNIVSHHLDKINARNEAVWIEDTNLKFIQEGNMGSKIGTGSDNLKNIKAIRLKNFIDRKIDFLKIDIEGVEYQVIKDIADNLHFVNTMFIEYHGKFDQNNELIEILEIANKSGFDFYIKEAASNYKTPFLIGERRKDYDIQLNIFCFRM